MIYVTAILFPIKIVCCNETTLNLFRALWNFKIQPAVHGFWSLRSQGENCGSLMWCGIEPALTPTTCISFLCVGAHLMTLDCLATPSVMAPNHHVLYLRSRGA